jgi:hypothetical protein
MMIMSLSGQMSAQLKLFAAEPENFLVNTLAFLQSYGVHDFLLEHGGC